VAKFFDEAGLNFHWKIAIMDTLGISVNLPGFGIRETDTGRERFHTHAVVRGERAGMRTDS